MRVISFLLLILLASPIPAMAVNPDEILADKGLETRARAISLGLRCLVCQNQSIDDSNSSLARDLRLIVRERLMAGDTDEQVKDYVASRFGNYVLLQPPFQMTTLVLWIAPAALLIVSISLLGIFLVRRNSLTAPDTLALSVEETAELERLRKANQ